MLLWPFGPLEAKPKVKTHGCCLQPGLPRDVLGSDLPFRLPHWTSQLMN